MHVLFICCPVALVARMHQARAAPLLSSRCKLDGETMRNNSDSNYTLLTESLYAIPSRRAVSTRTSR